MLDATTIAALAEPNRQRIVELLRDGPLAVGDIADRLGIRQPQASKHLRVLLDAGIVELRAVGTRRIYKLRPEPFQALDEWLSQYRGIWEERFDRLLDYLHNLHVERNETKTEE